MIVGNIPGSRLSSSYVFNHSPSTGSTSILFCVQYMLPKRMQEFLFISGDFFVDAQRSKVPISVNNLYSSLLPSCVDN